MRFLLCVLALGGWIAVISGCDTKTKNVKSCGDGFLDPGEDCDGAELGGATCASLGHYHALGTLRCAPGCVFDRAECGGRCGDGIVDAADHETCDGTALNGATCESLGFVGGGELACGGDCRHDWSGCVAGCGNGYVEGDEACDDGGLAAGDGCDAACAVEEGWICDDASPSGCEPICGDGVARGPEACDGDDLRGASCEGLGYHGGGLGCTAGCTLELTACEAAGRCGDQIVQDLHGEQCEAGVSVEVTCQELGFYEGTPACDAATCRFDTTGCAGRCGDGSLHLAFGEACDGAQLNGATCVALGQYDGTLACDAACAFELSGCGGRCGDETIQAGFGEECDGAELGGETCASQGFVSGTLTCAGDCRFEVSACVGGLLMIDGGDRHTCALKRDGGAWCWGDNASGQLGDGTTSLKDRPTPVSTLSSAVVDLSAGGDHTCAVKTDGSLWCWGENGSGQLGVGGSSDRTTPTQVTIPQVSRVAAGGAHTCALTTSGDVWCWGYNDYGQVGNGSTIGVSAPVRLFSLSGMLSLTAGTHHTCAVTGGNSVVCWGRNDYGQLGDGTTGQKSLPAFVSGIPTASLLVVAGGHHNCALTVNDEAWCWGYNVSGQLGDGTSINRTSAVEVSSLGGAGILGLSGGGRHTCARLAGTDVWCWGENGSGQLGDGATGDRPNPAPLQFAPTGFRFLGVGGEHSCAGKHDGTVWCWGSNARGQLGVGPSSNRTLPTQLSPF